MKTDETLHKKLRWVRIYDPVHIPREYIEQIKDREFSVERFYTFQEEICVNEGAELGFEINPFNLLFALADESNRVKGVLWMVVDVLTNSLVINTFSVDKEYWGNGKAVKLLIDKAIEVKNGAKLDRIYWITRCPKHSEKFGFKRSKQTLMEFSDYGELSERNISRNPGKTSGINRSDDVGAEEISCKDSQQVGTAVD